MKFQYKLVLCYAVLAIFFTALLAGTWHHFTVDSQYQQIQNTMEVNASRMASEFDNMYTSMKQVMVDLLSTQEILEAVRVFRYPALYDFSRHSYYDARMRSRINSDSFLSQYFRIIFFNHFGTTIYGSMYPEGFLDEAMKPKQRSILKAADLALGMPVLTAVHDDPWNNTSSQKVFSMIRAIQGDDLGYIEVEQKADILDKLFLPSSDEISVYVFLPEGELLYSSSSLEPALSHYTASGMDGFYDDMELKQLIYVSSTEQNIRILLSVPMSFLHSQLLHLEIILFIGILVLLLLSGIFILISSTYLTKPLRRIKQQIEKTNLSNIDQKFDFSSNNNEIEALGTAYNELLQRLIQSVDQEKKLSLLQLQAQFDTLQAQVNPHFLFNVLSVISHQGLKNNGLKVCEMCGNLASMLRYSTGTVQRYTTVEQELAYLNQYISLMKDRYEDELDVITDFQDAILQKALPKITIQQLVENSIQHGFNHTKTVMKIQVKGWADSQGWHISAADNGEGIDEKNRLLIRQHMQQIKQEILQQNTALEMEIGRMGLVNLFARLYFLYGEQLSFSVDNGEETGALISIHIKED